MVERLADAAKRVVARLRAAGFEAHFVGGCVRDLVMGKEPKDVDIATSARPQKVRELFQRTVPIGAQFGVILVLEGDRQFEVATFRADGEYVDGRRPKDVRFCDARSDVMRRDFTINGMLYDPDDERVIDYVGGQQDIDGRVVRCIGDPIQRLEEDKLRVMRAVRFACRLGFEIERGTWDAAKRVGPEIGAVSAERIRDELARILTEGGAARGVEMLHEIGALSVILPEVVAMAGVAQPEEFHPEGDVLTHTMLALAELSEPNAELAMATLVHDVGKPATMSVADRIRFHRHEEVGAEMAWAICRRLKFSNVETEKVGWLVGNHMRIAQAPEMRPARLKRLLREEHFEDLLELHRLDCLACHRDLAKWEFCRAKLAELSEEELRPAPLLDGRGLIDMGYNPGPIFKEMLGAIESAQLEGEISTKHEAEAFIRSRFPPDLTPNT